MSCPVFPNSQGMAREHLDLQTSISNPSVSRTPGFGQANLPDGSNAMGCVSYISRGLKSSVSSVKWKTIY